MEALSEAAILELERVLGFRLPDDVKAQYRVSNGMLGPTKCQMLYTYGVPGDADIVSANRIRNEEWFPAVFQSLVLLGNDGCGNNIGFDWSANQAILWNMADGNWVQETRPTVTEIWQCVEQSYANSP